MDTSAITIPLIILIVLGILVFRFVARVFLKVILLIILGIIALFFFIKGGMML